MVVAAFTPGLMPTVADVEGVLRRAQDPMLEAALAPILQATIEWTQDRCGMTWDANPHAPVTETFFDVTDRSTLYLKDVNPTGISVQFFDASQLDFVSDLFFNGSPWVFKPDPARVQLVSSRLVTVPGFPGAWQRRFARKYSQATVTYTPSGYVPGAVREAIALIAAATYIQQETDISGLRGETISGYSYQLDKGGTGLVIPERAQLMLARYNNRLRARTV